jgi:hypothetical protein
VSVRARANRLTLFFLRSHTHTHTLAPFSVILNQPVMFDFEKLDVYKKEEPLSGFQFSESFQTQYKLVDNSKLQATKQSECESESE